LKNLIESGSNNALAAGVKLNKKPGIGPPPAEPVDCHQRTGRREYSSSPAVRFFSITIKF